MNNSSIISTNDITLNISINILNNNNTNKITYNNNLINTNNSKLNSSINSLISTLNT